MHAFESVFGIGDKVIVDDCDKLVVTVTAVLWRNEKPTLEVSWFGDGQSRSAWVETWRVRSHDA